MVLPHSPTDQVCQASHAHEWFRQLRPWFVRVLIIIVVAKNILVLVFDERLQRVGRVERRVVVRRVLGGDGSRIDRVHNLGT